MSKQATQCRAEHDLQAADTETYRRNPYPSFIHPLTHPDRLAVVARLAGMVPPDVGTARVLEVGTGDGLNLLSIAATLPDAECVGFDIEPEGIGRGRQRLAAAGLGNARLEVGDLMDGLAGVEGSFDYIIAHGVFAWVPEPVAMALLDLIRARLSPSGIAFVSFNALPGSHATMALRAAMLSAAGDTGEPAERLERARAMLQSLSAPRAGDGPIQKALRAMASDRLDSDTHVMLHDELGLTWQPWHLRDVLAQARARGLMFLGDASYGQTGEGMLVDQPAAAPSLVQQFVEARACAEDDLAFRQFRRVLLVHDDRTPARHFDPRVVEALYATSYAEEVEPGFFAAGPRKIRCDHPPLLAALRRLVAAAPERIPVAELGLDDSYLRALADLFDFEMLTLHTLPTACAPQTPERPRASPLALAMVAEGMDWAATLDHRIVSLDAGAKEVLTSLSGERDRDAVFASLAERGYDGSAAVAGLARIALLTRAA